MARVLQGNFLSVGLYLMVVLQKLIDASVGDSFSECCWPLIETRILDTCQLFLVHLIQFNLTYAVSEHFHLKCMEKI